MCVLLILAALFLIAVKVLGIFGAIILIAVILILGAIAES